MIPKFEEKNDEMDQVFDNPMSRELMNEHLTGLANMEGSPELLGSLYDLLEGHDVDQVLHVIATLLVSYEATDPEVESIAEQLGVGDIEVSLADIFAQELFNGLTIDAHASPRIVLCTAAKLIAFTAARRRFLINKFGAVD